MPYIAQKYNDAVITKYIAATDNRGARYQVRDISGKRKYFPIDHALNNRANHTKAAECTLKYRGYDPADYHIISVYMPDGSMVHTFLIVN